MFEVSDTGCGVAKEGLCSLFKEYVQASLRARTLLLHFVSSGYFFVMCRDGPSVHAGFVHVACNLPTCNTNPQQEVCAFA